MEIMAGACVAAAVVALAGGYVAFRKRRGGGTKQKQTGSSGSVELQNREVACRGFSTDILKV
jgi:hypothetical protein